MELTVGTRGTGASSADGPVLTDADPARRPTARRHAEPPAPQYNPLFVTAPDDDEVYEYLGPQMRWIQLVLIAAFVLVAVSLVAFATTHVWLTPVLFILVLNVIGNTFSLFTGMNKRRVTWASHQQRVTSWNPHDGRYPSVDIFLPTCGESLEILRNTYEHVVAMSWPGRLSVYVLDDAAREEVHDLSASFGFDYVVRPDRGHLRKAGNLRNACRISRGELIVIFDADFCPRADFLGHLVPYLDDPQVAIVQSPQCFATTESMGWIQRTAGATQEFFYRWVLPSRDRIGAANCVGTSAIYRRGALDRVGGFAEIEHSEDLHTGRHVQQAGYTIRYVPVVLSRGLCPSDLAGFLNQQYRWCQGTLTRIRSIPEMRQPGIPSLPEEARSLRSAVTKGQAQSLRQRIARWAGVLYYITTALNVFLLFLPGVIMAAFYPEDVRPVQLVPFLLGLWVYVVLFPLVSRTRWRFEVLRIQMAYSYAHAVAIWHKVIGREIGWVPTGVIGKSNSLARSIAWLGATVLGASLLAFWVFIVRDVMVYGLAQFWMMVGLVLAYTYLALPLFVEFVKILMPRRRNRSAEVDPEDIDANGDAKYDDADAETVQLRKIDPKEIAS
ncbi:cellulose synthase catalytic subunit [Gordonia rubripertincta]|uniref:Cellulose synthase catalytic subunit n=2 Tax=Gordonia rubripertincta TaxID=36822 RepID=A0AAW6RE48_GORRU|nr:cellulose synthase catalytic subunit [Gordonia rubripertincta]MDG6782710.1 cellulose synthase catalytic subunit [Gordonia rubripertincta]NKY62031.1 glycosyltransferase [Gordonia rubripertincta]GAB86824.1 putative glycosyltransferase [Gordonia rubripertincta NBRC 101908]